MSDAYPRQEPAGELLRRAYADAEITIMDQITRRVERGLNASRWAQRKLAEIREMQKGVASTLGSLSVNVNTGATEIGIAYGAGNARGFSEIEALNRIQPTVDFVGRSEAVEALASQWADKQRSINPLILRRTDDVYREIVAQGAAQVTLGVDTMHRAVQAATNRFANVGVGGFRDKAGRLWDMATYSDMALRSAVGNASRVGHADRLTANGFDIVIVTGHEDGCPICAPWEGVRLSLSGETPGLDTRDDAAAAGLFHPNCSHSTVLWTRGLTRKETFQQTDPQTYLDRQTQRSNERAIRMWKRRERAVITPTPNTTAAQSQLAASERQKARAKVREWSDRQKRFLADVDRRRRRDREVVRT